MDIPAYLRRIGVDNLARPHLSALKRLQQRHMMAVPFENLDIGRGNHISLDADRLYDKMVERHRGGFCYELNTLFGFLLGELGYDVMMVSARVYNDRGILGPEFDHMALIATLDGRYLVDVGFGNSFREPLPLPDGKVSDLSGTYYLESVPDLDLGFDLIQEVRNDKKAQYRFTLIPRNLSDYTEMCCYHQESSESPFTQKSICTIATPNGRITLSDDKLTVSEGFKQRHFQVHTREEYDHLLKVHFGITLDDAVT